MGAPLYWRQAGAGHACTDHHPARPKQCWSLDFVSDSFICDRSCHIMCLVDDFSRECLALVADRSISGARVARELTAVIGQRSKLHMIVSDKMAQS
jgi:putative transposase